MKRIYLSKITLEDGQAITAVERIADSGAAGDNVKFTSTIAIAPDGTLPYQYALMMVDCPDHGPFIADPGNFALPDYPYDAQIAMMYGPTKDALRKGLKDRGFALESFDDNSDSYRGLIRALGQTIMPEFTEHNFDII